MKKVEFVLIVVFSIICFRWIIYICNIGKSLESKINPQITQVADTVYIECECEAIELFFYIDSIGKNECNDVIAKEVLDSIGVQHPHIVYAQMRLESGNYKSMLSQSNNNYFGMKQPYKRPTVSIGETNGYATYKSWAYSILDYALWQRRYANNLTEDEYYEKLSSYASDKEYINKVKQIAKDYGKIEN